MCRLPCGCLTALLGLARKGGAVEWIVWQTGTARLLPRLLNGRQTGPVFLTDRRARVQLPPGDIDPASGRARLSYSHPKRCPRETSGGATLHQLRHSALTHDERRGVHQMQHSPSGVRTVP
jgi:integrase/recombinase XerC/integrase/recombinase XerD